MAIHVGWARGRWAGLVIAGACFILPAMLMTAALGWAYVRCGRLPAAASLLWGVNPVIVAIVVQALWKLGATAAPTWPLRLVGVAAVAAAAAGVNDIAILLFCGAVMAPVRRACARDRGAVHQLLPLVAIAAVAAQR